MHLRTIRNISAFDATHRDSLSRLWFLGDVHGDFRHIGLALQRLQSVVTPRWLVFLGDLEIFDRSLCEIIAPLRAAFPLTRVAFIHGNHDADEHENWERLHDAGDAVPLHGQVVELDGVKVAGHVPTSELGEARPATRAQPERCHLQRRSGCPGTPGCRQPGHTRSLLLPSPRLGGLGPARSGSAGGTSLPRAHTRRSNGSVP